MKGKKRNILVYLIDDSQFIRHLASLIERHEDNVRIKTFRDAESCIIECNLKEPDLIFLDYYLNYRNDFEGNGDVVLRYVKEFMPHIKVVLLTNLSDKSRIDELLHIGFDGFIHKGEGNFLVNVMYCISKFTDIDHPEYSNFT